MLAAFASNPDNTKGRLYEEKPTPYRNEFERDRDRIIHSNAFKRLQYKTQVFVNHEGDHFRNRLTHSIEVSCVARSVAKALSLCDDLAEGVALAHDLGHTPFGHAGEEALNSCMKDYGGFSHNAHSLKILTKLEHKYGAYNGLNLTWEVLDGIVKHNGPLTINVPEYVLEYNSINDLELDRYSSAEAQIASLSDDIAYICHDLEDSVRAGIIDFTSLSSIDFLAVYIHDVQQNFPDLPQSRLVYEVVRKLAHRLIDSLLAQTRENINKQKLVNSSDVRALNYQLIDFREDTKQEIIEIKRFLFNNVYKHHNVTSMTLRCQKIVRDLFNLYMDNTDLLPFHWRNLIDKENVKSQASVIADYIAGMTDRFAIKEFQSFYNLNFNKL